MSNQNKPRPIWEWIVLAGLILYIAHSIAKGCSKEMHVKSERAKTEADTTRTQIKRNTDTITVSAGKVQQASSNVLKLAEKRQQQAKENIYKPTPSETDSVTLERANWLRGKN